MRLLISSLLAGLLCLTVAFPAAAIDLSKDVAGSKDIPGLPRYEGSIIMAYQLGEFDEAVVPLAPFQDGDWSDAVKLEGRVTRILYLAPPDRSSLEVIRNYENSLKELGYTTVFQCGGFDECGKDVDTFYSEDLHGAQFTETHTAKNAFSQMSVKDPRIVVAKGMLDGKESNIFIFAAYQENYHEPQASDRVAVYVQEVLAKPMENKMVVLKADELAQDIDATGKAAIYGIYFDYDKADIKPESKPQLEQMAAMLKSRPELNVLIVGHTDNQGGLDYNMGLSQRRAEAVAAALSKDFGIDGSRLTPKGVAYLAPVATNRTEEGRAKNRRVELVER
ncbi:OmpA family protein [Oceanidesulfovibrio marinus]|uniref:DUF4892 domain-containing protein n=1 Tax=Oceanidesulfovibrio marinus TaxID=370038 RepID=A0A6P1ZF48_9BACT|nr:OmpA family protein [Oceanidesulfovibrio marinus]TVM32308.1 DUF4892 domain-containing protein [Oceanidesulfovibrio marinus]